MQPTTHSTHTKSEDTATLSQVIEAYIDQKRRSAVEISPLYEELWVEISKLINSGSKRLRSKLVILGYRAFGGEDVDSVMPAAAAVELLHQAMLMHDDIIDRDYVRYGVDNIAGRYIKTYSKLVEGESDRIHYANSAALLAGDLLISESYQLLIDTKAPPEKIIELQRLLNRTIFEVVGGELLDTESAFRTLGEISSRTVAIYKTASYSFMMPLLMGALLADASDDEQSKIRLFGRNLGIGYQLRDDVIGVFGNQIETGKSTSGDIREGKQTAMVEQFYRLANEEQRQEFERYFGKSTISDDEVSKVRELLRSSGALQATEDAISDYEEKARTVLSQLDINSEYRDQMDEYISRAMRRVK